MRIDGHQRDFLNRCVWGEWEELEGSTVNVKGNVRVDREPCHELPVTFGHVSGSFSIGHCYFLESMKNFPRSVGGDFVCFSNERLSSLVGSPDSVNGIYRIKECPAIKSLFGITWKGVTGFHINPSFQTNTWGTKGDINLVPEEVELWKDQHLFLQAPST